MFFNYTESDLTQIRTTFFDEGEELHLKIFPVKQKKKYLTLVIISKNFEPGRKYTEKETNDILSEIYFDYVSIRRSLIDYKLMERTKDGSAYWVNQNEGS